MGNMCKKVTGLLMLLAGLMFLLGGLGSLGSATANMAGGVLLLLYGLGSLVHSMGMCGMCNENCNCGMDSKGTSKAAKK